MAGGRRASWRGRSKVMQRRDGCEKFWTSLHCLTFLICLSVLLTAILIWQQHNIGEERKAKGLRGWLLGGMRLMLVFVGLRGGDAAEQYHIRCSRRMFYIYFRL